MAKRYGVQWSELPKDLLSMIANKHLNTRIHNLRLRSVCRSWRSSIPLFNKPSPPLPLRLPFPISPSNLTLTRDCYFSITENTIYLLQPPKQNPEPNTPQSPEPFHSIPWLVRVEEIENCKVRVLNPFSQFLPEKMPETFPKELNLLDFRISEIGKAYSLSFIDLSHEPWFERCIKPGKVVVSSSPWSDASADDYAIMAIQGRELWFFKLGDNKWTTIEDVEQCNYYYEDLVYHEGQFYAIRANGRTVVIGSDLKAKPIASLGRCDGNAIRVQHLVKSFGDLFWFDILLPDDLSDDDYESVYLLKGFKLNEKEKKWEPIDILNDRGLFASDECYESYSVSAEDFTGLKGDCIYFFGEVIYQDESLAEMVSGHCRFQLGE